MFKVILKRGERRRIVGENKYGGSTGKNSLSESRAGHDEDGYLVRSEKASDLKTFDGRLLPSVMELMPADAAGNKTILKIIEMKFNISKQRNFSRQQNMKSIR